MNLRPLNSNVVVKPNKVEEKSPGGVFITASTKDSPTIEGTILAVGPGRRLETGNRARPEVEVGQVVIIPNAKHMEMTVDGEKCYIVPEEEIFAVYGPKG